VKEKKKKSSSILPEASLPWPPWDTQPGSLREIQLLTNSYQTEEVFPNPSSQLGIKTGAECFLLFGNC
jgi:hypothetical protein